MRNFREREGFIIIYDVTSKIQVAKLTRYFDKIRDCANIADFVVLFLGNNSSCRKFSREEIMTQQRRITAKHREDCTQCFEQRLCGRVIFDFFNLSTMSNRDVAMRKFALQLA